MYKGRLIIEKQKKNHLLFLFYNCGTIYVYTKIFVDDTLLYETKVYDSKAITVDHIFLGNKSDIIFSHIKNKSNAIMISFMMIITGLMLIDNMFMFVGMMPMLFFIDSHYDILRHKAIRYFCHIDLAVLTYCFIIQVTGITNFLHIIGFILLAITGIFESIKYAGTDGSDRAEILRFGMLLFIVCFAIGNQINNYKMIAKGAQFELIKNLAYKDGLTELGNRTSYLEKLNSLVENNIKRVGIVFLDINNLKQINDNYGHEAGDESIKEADELMYTNKAELKSK